MKVLINNGKSNDDIARKHLDNEEKKERRKIRTGKDGKPEIKLTPLERTVVSTRTRGEYDALMQVYECGGWRWNGGDLPTYPNHWPFDKANICIEAGLSSTNDKKGKFGYLGVEADTSNYFRIISLYDFYKRQKITPKVIKQINKYFENAKNTN